jgi:hypothetical protein
MKNNMRKLLIILILGNTILNAQSFDYMLFGKSNKQVNDIYLQIGHKLSKIYVYGNISEAVYSSPREGFICISYVFKHDSCIAVNFYYDRKWNSHIKKSLNANFDKKSKNVWIWNDKYIIIFKFAKRLNYLQYVRQYNQ